MRRTVAVWAIVWALAATAFAGEATLPGLLDKMHKVSSAEGQPILGEILKLGPSAIREVCGMLLPPGKGDDAKAHFALHGLALYVVRPGADDERQMLVTVLIEALQAAQDKDVKGFLIRQLQLAGKDEAVAPLAKCLGDPALCDPAAQALTQIATPAAIGALLKALPDATDAARVTLIKALGDLRARAAAPTIVKDATSSDRTLRLAALLAVANIGEPSAAPLLAKAMDVASPYERSQVVGAYLLLARRLAEGGDNNQCATICRDLLRTCTAPRDRNIVSAALSTLAGALGAGASAELFAAMDSKDLQVRAATMDILAKVPGKDFTAELVRRFKQAPVPLRIALLPVFAARGDRGASDTILEAVQDRDKAVRLAAIPVAAQLEQTGAVEPLLNALQTDQPDEVKAIQRALQPLVNDTILKTLAAQLPKVPPASRVALLEILAARGHYEQFDTVLPSATDPDPAVRQAAVKALGALADAKDIPRLIAILLKAEGAEQAGAQRAVVAACERIRDADLRADPIVTALGAADAARRPILLRTLPRLGGERALLALDAEMKSPDPGIRDTVVRALAEWPDVSVVPKLLDVARTAKELPHQVLALQGCVRLASDPKLAPEKRGGILKDVLAAAKRPEEKALAIASLAGVRSVDALKILVPFLDDPALQREAAAAAVKIACPQDGKDKGLEGPAVATTLQKVLEVSKEPNVRKQAESQLKRLKPGS